MKINRGMNDQWIPNATIMIGNAAQIAIKINLRLLYADPFLNFIDSIGISLMRSRDSTTETIGMK